MSEAVLPYVSIPPIGQNDKFSCWAACLAWWLKAVGGGRPSWTQNRIIAEYDKHTDGDGGFPPARIRDVWLADQRLKMMVGTFNSRDFWDKPLPIGKRPELIAFVHPEAGTHMNVVFNPMGRTVMAMEPYFPYPGSDGRRTGQILERSMDFYVKDNFARSHEIMLFWPDP